jgi:DNA ligase-1
MHQDNTKLRVLYEFMKEINLSNSTNYKLEILSKYRDNDFIKYILYYTYNPYYQYGVTSKNLKKRSDLASYTDLNIFSLLDKLRTGKLTGNSAISTVNGYINLIDPEYSYLIYQIIDHNLETRATSTQINKVFHNLIPTFDVALAHDATKVKGVNLFDGTWYAMRKLDGIRLITVILDGTPKFFSRNGKEIHTLDKLKYSIEAMSLPDIILDGELCLSTEDGSDDFQGIMKEVQRKGHTIQNPKYWVFDILTSQEFSTGLGEDLFIDRLNRFDLDSKMIVKLDTHQLNSEEDLVSLKLEAQKYNWEGLMARKNSGYEGTRTKKLLKLKEFHDAEYKVVDLIMGPQRIIENGQEVSEEVLSAVVIEHRGNRVKVGSGFTIDERRYYYENPQEIKDSTITVTFFEETQDQHGNYSLRFPVFKTCHGAQRTV